MFVVTFINLVGRPVWPTKTEAGSISKVFSTNQESINDLLIGMRPLAQQCWRPFHKTHCGWCSWGHCRAQISNFFPQNFTFLWSEISSHHLPPTIKNQKAPLLGSFSCLQQSHFHHPQSLQCFNVFTKALNSNPYLTVFLNGLAYNQSSQTLMGFLSFSTQVYIQMEFDQSNSS